MSKPILSELEYNADDVASAILSVADLSVTNQDFGVTDITDKFVPSSGNDGGDDINQVYTFNGFVFVNIYAKLTSASGHVDLWQISDSDYYPNDTYYTNSISYEGDYVGYVSINTSGLIKAYDVTAGSSSSDDTHRIFVNMWYRV